MAVRDLAALPARCRHRFPIFEQQVYVNSCSQGALSDAVRGAYEAYLRDWDEHGAPWEYWVEQTERARAACADLIGAEPDQVAITTSESPDPVLPRRPVLVPVGQVVRVGIAHGVGERPLRAAVDVDAALEDREAMPDAGRERVDANGQGRPSSDLRS